MAKLCGFPLKGRYFRRHIHVIPSASVQCEVLAEAEVGLMLWLGLLLYAELQNR